ncbi:Uncharacterized protein PHSC3_001129 [Chlamydiales bacterium STE3]|nr:Uncharacterized protein PHSC3_001129 [Chlamydiales bacterium STE3]
MSEEKIDRIEEISESLKSEPAELGGETNRAAPNKDQFDTLLNLEDQKAPTQKQVETSSDKTSLMDEVRSINQKVGSIGKATSTELAEQANGVIAQIEEVKSKLTTPDLEIKGSVQTLLRNKLSHIDENLKIALNRAGLEYAAPPEGLSTTTTKDPGNLANPIERFLGLLTHGQYQLQRLANDIEHMRNTPNDINPASMLAIQLKMGYVQQELELFANLLNKSLESIKTIMNVQV